MSRSNLRAKRTSRKTARASQRIKEQSGAANVPWRNKTPYGWWVTEYVETFEPADANRRDLSRRCLAWLNTIIFKAPNRESAYRKAVSMSKIGNGVEKRGGKKVRRCFMFYRVDVPSSDLRRDRRLDRGALERTEKRYCSASQVVGKEEARVGNVQ
jgi:hypothetical protein